MKWGIIGGSGLDDPRILSNYEEIGMHTPYGEPSSSITYGKISGQEVYILARHGRKHQITPTHVNNRANIYALKHLGCTNIIATTACGSLKEEIKPGDLVILDQFLDETKHRVSSFHQDFTNGVVHQSLANPFSEEIRKDLIESCRELNFNYHPKGTVVTIEGPRFSTKAESNKFRLWGADVINMSTSPEASLAKEIGIEYAAVAMSTDYDCWKEGEEAVTFDMIMRTMNDNADKVKKLIIHTIQKKGREEDERDKEYIKSKINTHPNWPIQGVMFRDINSLIRDKEAYSKTLKLFEDRYSPMSIDAIAGIESRGFIWASTLADRMGKPLILVRKKGKLPFETLQQQYDLEYGTATIEIQREAVTPGKKVLVLDDLIATGGTAIAACELIKKAGGEVVEVGAIVDLPELKGKQKIQEKGFSVFNLVEFEGE